MIGPEWLLFYISKLAHATGDQYRFKTRLKARQNISFHIVANNNGIFRVAFDMV